MNKAVLNISDNLKDFNFSYTLTDSILKTFIKQGLFEADFINKTHFSQYPYILGAKNHFYFYDIEKSLFLFYNAIRFLKSINLKNKVNFVFVGSPKGQEAEIKWHFKHFGFKCTFFSNGFWHSGYISKLAANKNIVLILYNITLNSTALREAISRDIPVVGFATPSCDIRGVDYPILLNFKKLSIIYVKLFSSLLKS